jgi:hypothetical protein
MSGLGTQSEPLPGAFDFSPNVPHGAMFLLDFAVIDDLLNRVLNTQAAHECRIDFLGDIDFILMFVSGFVVVAYIEKFESPIARQFAGKPGTRTSASADLNPAGSGSSSMRNSRANSLTSGR